MTETEWNGCRDPDRMLAILQVASHRTILALFGCACCRRIWHFLSDERLRRGVEFRERCERGGTAEAKVMEAVGDAYIARQEVRTPLKSTPGIEQSPEGTPGWAAGAAFNATRGLYSVAADMAAHARACADGGDWQRSYEVERAAQCDLLRSMVSYPHDAKRE
jgi:hypothetical protein